MTFLSETVQIMHVGFLRNISQRFTSTTQPKEEKKEGKIGYYLIYDEYGNSKDKIGQPKTNAPRFHKKAQ